jgi:hypothetical protein
MESRPVRTIAAPLRPSSSPPRSRSRVPLELIIFQPVNKSTKYPISDTQPLFFNGPWSVKKLGEFIFLNTLRH